MRIFSLLALLIILYFALRWFVKTPPERVARLLRQIGIAAVVILFIFLAATGRLHWLFALLASVVGILLAIARSLMPLLLRFAPTLYQFYQRHRFTQPPPEASVSGQTSTVQSHFLRMTLDHDSGEMDGEVLTGQFVGCRLSELEQEQLSQLFEECHRCDDDSAALLEAYLDRKYGDDWRGAEQASQQRSDHTAQDSHLTHKQAYEILGLEAGATHEQIVDAHRRLIQKLHPDRGGSTYLAAKINQAKDLLLEG
ncbi:MAG: DnaJ domain-containing protein [Candidatus Polarisedimenticolaceae bacterium]|nr:DnaJ domain-containing protein [Candidatus Polarisedimenticolaceae bacterium]